MPKVGLIAIATASATLALGCSAGPEPIAFQNKVFYEYGQLGDDGLLRGFEEPYPPLDLQQSAPKPDYIGVKVLQGTVRLSRPRNWTIRRASNEPQGRFIEYISPNQIVFAVYERIESPREPWRVVMSRYEEELKEDGGLIVHKPAAAATWNAQARVYDVQRPVPASKAPFLNFSREYLARSDHRIVLLQLIRPTESLAPVSSEMLRVLETLQVL